MDSDSYTDINCPYYSTVEFIGNPVDQERRSPLFNSKYISNSCRPFQLFFQYTNFFFDWSLKKRLLSAYNLEKRPSILQDHTHEKNETNCYCKLSEITVLQTCMHIYNKFINMLQIILAAFALALQNEPFVTQYIFKFTYNNFILGLCLHESGVLGASPDGFIQGVPRNIKVNVQGKFHQT